MDFESLVLMVGGPAVVAGVSLGVVRWALDTWKEVAIEAGKREAETAATIAIERIRGEVQIGVDLAQAQNSSLVTRRFVVLETLHLKILDAERATEAVTVAVTEGRQSKAVAALNATQALTQEVEQARIWLSVESYEAMKALTQALLNHSAAVTFHAALAVNPDIAKDIPLAFAAVDPQQVAEFAARSPETFREMLPQIRNARENVERDFRVMLGVLRG